MIYFYTNLIKIVGSVHLYKITTNSGGGGSVKIEVVWEKWGSQMRYSFFSLIKKITNINSHVLLLDPGTNEYTYGKSISYLTKYSKLCIKNILHLTKNINKIPLIHKRPNFNLELTIVYS